MLRLASPRHGQHWDPIITRGKKEKNPLSSWCPICNHQDSLGSVGPGERIWMCFIPGYLEPEFRQRVEEQRVRSVAS